MMDLHEVVRTFWTDLISRPQGPYGFRFLLQPAMAVIAATIDGIKDARTGRSPYLWTILFRPDKRDGRLHEGWKATLRILLLGAGMEAVYQYRMFKTFHVVESLVIIFVLAFLPYVMMRGPIARIAHRWMASRHKPGSMPGNGKP